MLIQLNGVSGGIDRRGLVVVKYKFACTDTDEISALKATLPVSPAGLAEVGREIENWVSNSNFIISARFEGDIREEPTESQDQFFIGGEWREEPIETFTDREALEKEYGAYEDPDTGRLKFPETLESASSGGIGKQKASTKNPLFGTTTFPALRLVAVHSYVRKTVPASVFTNVGNVVKNLPAGFDAPPNKTWIVDTPQVRWRGTCWEIVEKWKDVENLQHLEALYLLLGKRRRS